MNRSVARPDSVAILSAASVYSHAQIDEQIAEAEAAYERALTAQRAMRRDAPHSEAVVIARTVDALHKKAADLRGRRFAVVAGVEQPEPPPPPKLQEKLDWLDVRVQSVALLANAQRSIARGIPASTAGVEGRARAACWRTFTTKKRRRLSLLRKEIDVVPRRRSLSRRRRTVEQTCWRCAKPREQRPGA